MPVSQFFGRAVVEDIGSLDVSGANTAVLQPGTTVHVKRVIFVTTTAITVANAVISYGVRDADGGNSTTIGTFPAPFSGSATDDVKYAEVAKRQSGPTTAIDGSIVYEGGDGLIEVAPGQEFFLTSDGGATAGVVQAYVEYVPEAFNPETTGFAEMAVTLS